MTNQLYLNVESTVSEKGQITLPKPVRDMLELNYGDKVGFYKTSEGLVLKNNSTTKSNSTLNLVEQLVRSETQISVQGSMSFGKSQLISTLVHRIHRGKTILVLGDDLYSSIVGYYRNNNLESDFSEIIKCDSLKLDEVKLLVSSDKIDIIILSDLYLDMFHSSEATELENLLASTDKVVFCENYSLHRIWGSKSVIEVELTGRVRSDYDYNSMLTIGLYKKTGGLNGVGDYKYYPLYRDKNRGY